MFTDGYNMVTGRKESIKTMARIFFSFRPLFYLLLHVAAMLLVVVKATTGGVVSMIDNFLSRWRGSRIRERLTEILTRTWFRCVFLPGN
jgi:hypothetical protein